MKKKILLVLIITAAVTAGLSAQSMSESNRQIRNNRTISMRGPVELDSNEDVTLKSQLELNLFREIADVIYKHLGTEQDRQHSPAMKEEGGIRPNEDRMQRNGLGPFRQDEKGQFNRLPLHQNM